MTTLSEQAKQDAKSENAQVRGGWFKFKEGKNRLRVLVNPEVIYEDFKLGMCYTDCRFKGSIKYLAYVWDYADGSVKLMKIPFSIFNWIAAQETDEDWNFQGFPMPYDITITAENAGTKEVKYSTTPSPKREPMSEEVLADVKRRKLVAEIIAGLKEKNEEKHRSDGTWDTLHASAEEQEQVAPPEKEGVKYPEEDINPEDIPF